MAAQMSAENALRKSETTHNAWKLASDEANKQHAILRRMQLVAATYERDLESAGASSAASRSSSATASQAAANAKQAVNAMRAKAGSSTEAQFAAEEMAAAARAAAFGGGGSGGGGSGGASGGGLLGAMRDAKDAWRKLAAVTSKFGKPCALPGVEKPKPKVKKPELEIAAAPPPMPQKEAPPPASPRVFAVEPGDAGLISTRAFLTPRSSLPLEDTSAEQSSFQARDIGQEMTQNLQEQLAANPASVEDASLFEPPALPQFSKEIPLSLGSFDTSVAADAPKV